MTNADFSYAFVTYGVDGVTEPKGRWSESASIDGRGRLSTRRAQPPGEEPVLPSRDPCSRLISDPEAQPTALITPLDARTMRVASSSRRSE